MGVDSEYVLSLIVEKAQRIVLYYDDGSEASSTPFATRCPIDVPTTARYRDMRVLDSNDVAIIVVKEFEIGDGYRTNFLAAGDDLQFNLSIEGVS